MTTLDPLRQARSPLAWILMLPILLWRLIPKPGPYRCRFYPSCSSYALEAIARHGAIRGLALGVWRVLRCHPWNPGGVDHVPERGRGRSSGGTDPAGGDRPDGLITQGRQPSGLVGQGRGPDGRTGRAE